MDEVEVSGNSVRMSGPREPQADHDTRRKVVALQPNH